MSSYGAPDCPLCGAHTNYCHLETPTGISIDCRRLKLRDESEVEWNIELAKALREASNG